MKLKYQGEIYRAADSGYPEPFENNMVALLQIAGQSQEHEDILINDLTILLLKQPEIVDVYSVDDVFLNLWERSESSRQEKMSFKLNLTSVGSLFGLCKKGDIKEKLASAIEQRNDLALKNSSALEDNLPLPDVLIKLIKEYCFTDVSPTPVNSILPESAMSADYGIPFIGDNFDLTPSWCNIL